MKKKTDQKTKRPAGCRFTEQEAEVMCLLVTIEAFARNAFVKAGLVSQKRIAKLMALNVNDTELAFFRGLIDRDIEIFKREVEAGRISLDGFTEVAADGQT